ncbi:hypothetical protein, partial [Helicobacter pullorum]|uniref:hypothetical protein n=1 Tax=Helicobacter pullorum TaxID=35818 RepID=UPI001181AE98
MKLESSSKLDSKTRQKSNKESESKQPKKIQKVKTCDSKKPAKSKNSSKLKSFIRTIPISIALASALSSQAVADWNDDGGACGNGYNCTISKDLNLNSNRGNIQITASGSTGTLTIDSGYTVAKVLNSPFGDNGLFSIQGTAEGLTNNGTISSLGAAVWRNILVNRNANLGYIVNNGKMIASNVNIILEGTVGRVVNTGTMITEANDNHFYRSVINIEGNAGADLIFSGQSLTQSTKNRKNVIWAKDGVNASFGNILVEDNSKIEGNFDFNNGTTGKSIIFQDSANMIGEISFEGRVNIANGIAIQDSASMTGNISLAGNSAIANGITIGGNSSGGSGNNASVTGNISLAGQSRVSKILIDGSNMGGSGINGTPKLDGDITLTTSQGITDGITIANGGTLDGNINAQSSSSIGGIAINNGSLIGSILLTNNARIQGGIVLDSANMTGNISLSTANSGGNITIDSINIGNGSTMTGDISLVGNSKITDSIT